MNKKRRRCELKSAALRLDPPLVLSQERAQAEPLARPPGESSSSLDLDPSHIRPVKERVEHPIDFTTEIDEWVEKILSWRGRL